mmetsp:Transcript_31650/g.94315  ORF Transcript_31650/g.94315 Transcript_31650/m.94315 type:complete len:207 (+) Transcript_31650:169-789(+)
MHRRHPGPSRPRHHQQRQWRQGQQRRQQRPSRHLLRPQIARPPPPLPPPPPQPPSSLAQARAPAQGQEAFAQQMLLVGSQTTAHLLPRGIHPPPPPLLPPLPPPLLPPRPLARPPPLPLLAQATRQTRRPPWSEPRRRRAPGSQRAAAPALLATRERAAARPASCPTPLPPAPAQSCCAALTPHTRRTGLKPARRATAAPSAAAQP